MTYSSCLLPAHFPSRSSYYSASSDRGGKYCDERVCLSVVVRVCFLSAIISSELHCPVYTKFLCMLPMAVARSSSGSVLIRYVLPVLWMTSYFLISKGCSTSQLS